MRDGKTDREISSLSVVGEVPAGLATFTDEALATTNIAEGYGSGMAALPDESYQDIKAYFERPRLLDGFSMFTTRTASTSYAVSNPVAFWPLAAQQRLNGVFGYRADVKFTLTVAATPFQQGVLLGAWQYSTSVTEGINIARSRFPALTTNLPHVRLDLSETTMGELLIPYNSPWDYFQLRNSVAEGGDGLTFEYGLFSVHSLLPYKTLSGSNTPEVKVYISLHNMVLYGAVPVSSNTAIPQAGGRISLNKELNSRPTAPPDGIVSGALRAGSVAAPFIGSVLNTVLPVDTLPAAARLGWQLNSAADLAKSCGFSKPVDEKPVERVLRTDYAHDDHVDQPSEAMLIAPFQSNRLAIDGFKTGTTTDEMSMKFVLGRYAQAFLGDVTTSDLPGTVLYATNLCPTSFWFRTNSGRPGGSLALPASATLTTNAIQPTALCYVSQMFRYWRGGIKFRFTFAKTKFHGGRILAAYVPVTYDTGADIVLSNPVPLPEIGSTLVQPFQHSAIFDLKDSNTFEFEVPFVTARPWLSVYGTSGGVSLSVIDRLLTSGQTSSSVDYLVEVAAADDYRLASFVGSGLVPIATGTPNNIVVRQSGDVLGDIDAQTMGETFTSLKQVLMIPTKNRTRTTQSTTSLISLPHWFYRPNLPIVNPLPATFQVPFCLSNQVAIAAMYCFVSGGTEYHIYADNPRTGLFMTYESAEGGINVAGLSDPRRRTTNGKPIITNSADVSVLHVKVPSYQKVARLPVATTYTNTNLTLLNTASLANGTTGTPFIGIVPTLGIAQSDDAVNPTNVTVSYAAADDAFAFAYVGPPPVCAFQSTQSNTPDYAQTVFAP